MWHYLPPGPDNFDIEESECSCSYGKTFKSYHPLISQILKPILYYRILRGNPVIVKLLIAHLHCKVLSFLQQDYQQLSSY